MFKKPAFVLTVLMISLAFNCVGLGLIVSPEFRFMLRVHPALDHARDVVASVPPEMRQALREQIANRHDALQRTRGELRTARQDVAQLIQQPEFDEPALRAKLAVVREKSAAVQEVVQDSFIGVLRGLPPAERARHVKEILRKLQAGLESRGPPHERRSADDGPDVHAPDSTTNPSLPISTGVQK